MKSVMSYGDRRDLLLISCLVILALFKDAMARL